jgi:anti-sigma factor RsiW
MECKEFQKLLSPFVDNELGAHDAFMVAEHLEVCTPCHREMETLRRFDEQLKTAGRIPLDGVEDFRLRILDMISPWGWARRWRGLGAAAAVLMFLVIGPQIFSAPADPETDAFSQSLISEVQLNINQPFSLPWLDPQSLHNVLRQEGLNEIPSLAPAGFHFEGGRVSNPLSRPFIQLVYRNSNEEISLFVSRRWDRPFSGTIKRDGFTIVPLGIRAVFLVTKDSLSNFVDTRQVAEEEINALSS